MAFKKSTRKTSGGAKLTTTYHTNGNVRRTHTVKPTKSLTVSRSVNRNGSVRTTTTNNINGWITRKSTTTGNPPKIKKARIPKAKSYSSGRRRRSRGGDGGGEIILALLLLAFIIPWYAVKYYCIGCWKVSQSTVKQEEKNFKWYAKVTGYFILYTWLVAILLWWASRSLFGVGTNTEKVTLEPVPVVEIQQND